MPQGTANLASLLAAGTSRVCGRLFAFHFKIALSRARAHMGPPDLPSNGAPQRSPEGEGERGAGREERGSGRAYDDARQGRRVSLAAGFCGWEGGIGQSAATAVVRVRAWCGQLATMVSSGPVRGRAQTRRQRHGKSPTE